MQLTRLNGLQNKSACDAQSASTRFMIDGLREPVYLAPTLRPILDTVLIWALRTCHWVRVTSGNDHIHAWNSLHYTNQAVDLMSDNLDELNSFLSRIGYRTLYQVRGHFNHVHVELASRGLAD